MVHPGAVAMNLPEGTQFVPEPGCGLENNGEDQGYLIVYAVDGTDNPIKFDGLIGAVTLRGAHNNSCPTCAERYQAIPIQAAESVPTDPSTSSDGKLHFDGINYKTLTDSVFGGIVYSGPTFAGRIDAFLTLLTLDVGGFGSTNDGVNVEVNFYNEGEVSNSTITSFRCYRTYRMQGTLSDISGSPDNTFGRKGLIKIGPAQFTDGSPATVLGLFETLELAGPEFADVRTRWYADVLYNSGTAVSTTFAPGVDPPATLTTAAPAGSPEPTPLTAPAPIPSVPSVPTLKLS